MLSVLPRESSVCSVWPALGIPAKSPMSPGVAPLCDPKGLSPSLVPSPHQGWGRFAEGGVRAGHGAAGGELPLRCARGWGRDSSRAWGSRHWFRTPCSRRLGLLSPFVEYKQGCARSQHPGGAERDGNSPFFGMLKPGQEHGGVVHTSQTHLASGGHSADTGRRMRPKETLLKGARRDNPFRPSLTNPQKERGMGAHRAPTGSAFLPSLGGGMADASCSQQGMGPVTDVVAFVCSAAVANNGC